MKTEPARINPLLSKRRFDLAHFHLGDVAAELDPGSRDRGLKLFGFSLLIV